MAKLLMIFGAILCVLLGYVSLVVWNILFILPSRPTSADENPWWGPGEPKKEDVVIKKFLLNVSDSVSRNLLQQ